MFWNVESNLSLCFWPWRASCCLKLETIITYRKNARRYFCGLQLISSYRSLGSAVCEQLLKSFQINWKLIGCFQLCLQSCSSGHDFRMIESNKVLFHESAQLLKIHQIMSTLMFDLLRLRSLIKCQRRDRKFTN